MSSEQDSSTTSKELVKRVRPAMNIVDNKPVFTFVPSDSDGTPSGRVCSSNARTEQLVEELFPADGDSVRTLTSLWSQGKSLDMANKFDQLISQSGYNFKHPSAAFFFEGHLNRSTAVDYYTRQNSSSAAGQQPTRTGNPRQGQLPPPVTSDPLPQKYDKDLPGPF